MNYKKIIKNRSIRLKILRFFSFIPDRIMLKIQYKIKTGRKLNLKNPSRYTEKLQWYKINYKNPLMVSCVDKYDVRQYIESIGLSEILIKCLGVYETFEEINWDNLPQSFVLKDTLGGGGNSVIIIEDKSKMDYEKIKAQLNQWIKEDYRHKSGGREWPYYSGKQHRIIIEEYIESNKEDGGLIDFKFLCFNGKVELVYVLADRIIGQEAGCGFFDADFNRLPYTEDDEPPLKREIKKPNNFVKLKEIAEKISVEFPCARIDLYNEKEKILFGEITFFDGSGYMSFDPDWVDYELGRKFKL